MFISSLILFHKFATKSSMEGDFMNNDIRLHAAGKGVRLWQIAERLGIRDSSLSRKLRYPLTTEERERILQAIRELSERAN